MQTRFIARRLIEIIFFAGFVSMAGSVATQDAWGADIVVYAIQGGNDVLGTLDLNTGVFTQTSTQALNDYELGEYAGALYGANVGPCGCLFQINPTTGIPTYTPIPFSNNGNSFGALNGFGSTNAGLFAVGAAFGGINNLYSIDPVSGNPTLIGPTGVTSGGGTGFLSASVDSGSLYWAVQTNSTDALYSIDTSTGVATLIGAPNEAYPSKTGNPFSLVFTGGTLWANFYAGGFGTISTSTGAQTLVSTAPTGSSNAFFGIAPYPVSASAPAFVGSMPHLAAEGGWTTTFTFVNKGATPAISQTNLFAPGGTALTLPIVFPQTSGSETASSITQTIAPAASFIVEATGPSTMTYEEGSAQLGATGAVDGFAIFHFAPNQQEAVVPLETRAASSYLLAFDNTNGVLTGVAIANVSTASASIPVIIRDDQGNVLSTTSVLLGANGHTSFVLSDPAAGFPVTANIRGTLEFSAPSGSQISVLGIRYTPPGTMTTIPSLANVGTAGGLMAHLASGSGWQTTFALVNTGTTAANATLNFYGDSGAALSLPLTFTQTGATSTASSVSQSIAAGATLWVESSGPLSSALLEGSAQLTTNGNISGYAIFRYNPNGQEAVVPLETRDASTYLLAFDNTSGTVTGIAIGGLSTQAVNVPVILRDDTGAQVGTGSIALPANGHYSQILSTLFPSTANIRGTVEFDAPAGVEISVLGIRSPPALTFTTLPPLAN